MVEDTDGTPGRQRWGRRFGWVWRRISDASTVWSLLPTTGKVAIEVAIVGALATVAYWGFAVISEVPASTQFAGLMVVVASSIFIVLGLRSLFAPVPSVVVNNNVVTATAERIPMPAPITDPGGQGVSFVRRPTRGNNGLISWGAVEWRCALHPSVGLRWQKNIMTDEIPDQYRPQNPPFLTRLRCAGTTDDAAHTIDFDPGETDHGLDFWDVRDDADARIMAKIREWRDANAT